MKHPRPLWREPLAYPVVSGSAAGFWVLTGQFFEPDTPWEERAITGASFGLVMVLVTGLQDWRRQRSRERQ